MKDRWRIGFGAAVTLVTTATFCVSGCHNFSAARREVRKNEEAVRTIKRRELDEQIAKKQRELDELKRQPKPPREGQSIEELERANEDKRARIKFLKDEITALLEQRKAIEIYYREKEFGK